MCSARCRAWLAKKKWLAALKLAGLNGEEHGGGQVPEQRRPAAEADADLNAACSTDPGRQEPVGLDGRDVDGSVGTQAGNAPAPAPAPPRRPSVVVVSPPRRPSVEVYEEPPARPPSVEVIDVPPAPSPPLVVIDDNDNTLPDAATLLRCPNYPTCVSVFPSECDLQDHLDTAHMQLVPLQTVDRLFKLMRFVDQSHEELAEQIEDILERSVK